MAGSCEPVFVLWNRSNSATVIATCINPFPSKMSPAQQTRFWKLNKKQSEHN